MSNVAFQLKKIALVFCYYGKWPNYFKFFLKSCEYNPDVDFIIITDIEKPKQHPKNIKFVTLRLKEVENIASQKLDFQADLSSPYKLCDFKPAYGFLFDDLLKGYDFWGHGDIDVIYGNIRNFITPEILEAYDTISVRSEYPSGFFMLFRNTYLVTTLFKRSKDYQKVFSSPKHYCFDECNFEYHSVFEGDSIFDRNAEMESMMHVIKRAEQENAIVPLFDTLVMEWNPGQLKWEKGVLSYRNKYEVLLYHMNSIQGNVYFKFSDWEQIPETYYIGKTTFFKNDKKSIKGALPFFFNEKIKVNLMMFKYACLIILNHFYILFVRPKRDNNKAASYVGSYWLGGGINFIISLEQATLYINLKREKENKSKLLPYFGSNLKFTSTKFGMILKFELDQKKKKMIVRVNDGKILNLTTMSQKNVASSLVKA